MRIASFQEMYTAELQELRNAEMQVGEAFRRMAGMASDPALKEVLARDQQDASAQEHRLGRLLLKRGADPQAHVDQAMQALVGESDKMMSLLSRSELRDAGIIASAQKLKHYEIAAYGTAAALAGQLDLRDDQALLHQCLEEEKRADAFLTDLAKSVVNPKALAAS